MEEDYFAKRTLLLAGKSVYVVDKAVQVIGCPATDIMIDRPKLSASRIARSTRM